LDSLWNTEKLELPDQRQIIVASGFKTYQKERFQGQSVGRAKRDKAKGEPGEILFSFWL